MAKGLEQRQGQSEVQRPKHMKKEAKQQQRVQRLVPLIEAGTKGGLGQRGSSKGWGREGGRALSRHGIRMSLARFNGSIR